MATAQSATSQLSSSSPDHLMRAITQIQYRKHFSRFLATRCYYLVYPSILYLGACINYLIADETLKRLPSSPLISPKSSVNQIFAYQGNQIFTVLFVGLYITRFARHLSLDASKRYEILSFGITLLRQFVVRLTVKCAGLMFLFYVIDNIFLFTGGKCHVSETVANALASASTSLETCSSYNGTWVSLQKGMCFITPVQFEPIIRSAETCRKFGLWKGGLDVSGHFCFLTTVSLILWNELTLLEPSNIFTEQADGSDNPLEKQTKIHAEEIEEKTWTTFTVFNLWRWFVLLTLLIWAYLLMVTATFYHTFAEKLYGLFFGYVTPLIIYYVPWSTIPYLRDIFT